MSKPKSPKTPDPVVQTNAEASVNRYNIEGPSGSQTWTQGPQQVIGYDSNGKPQMGSTSTQHIDLGDSEQRQYDTRNSIAEGLLGNAQDQIKGFDQPFSYDNQGSKAGDAAFQRQMAYLDPEFKKADTAFEDKLANQGIPMGSEAYDDALRQHDNDQNFAKSQAALAAESEGAQLGLSQRQQQYNELAAALGSEQVNPVQSYGTQATPIDVAGAYQNANNAQLAKYNAGASSNNAMMGGLGQLGSAAIMQWSDERLKDDIEPVGEMPTGEGIYEYSYKWEDEDAPKHTGVMAQEIEENYPDAVVDTPSGFKAVNYEKIAAALREAA